MQKVWLVKTSSIKLKKITEIYYYFTFFVTSFQYTTFIYNKPFIKYFFKITPLLPLASKNVLRVGLGYNLFLNKLHKFNYFSIDFFFKSRKNENVFKYTSRWDNPAHLNLFKSSSLHLLFYNLFFIINYININSQFHRYHIFYLSGVSRKLNSVYVMDISKFFKRWSDIYGLLFNIFFYNYTPIFFGTPVFKNETLALNWYFSDLDTNMWKYAFPFFIYKLSSFNKKFEFFLEKLKTANISFYFIIDCFYHLKLLPLFNKQNLYTIGLVSNNTNPWLVSYPVPVLSSNLFAQFFFLKLLTYVQKHTLFTKYIFFRNVWTHSLLTTKISHIVK